MKLHAAIFYVAIGMIAPPTFADEWKFMPGARVEDWPIDTIAILSGRPAQVFTYLDPPAIPDEPKDKKWRDAHNQSDRDTRRIDVITKHVARIPANPTKEFRMVASPDFTRIAMTEPYEKDRWYIAVDDRVWEFYEVVDSASLQFSEDSKHVLCAARWENYWFIVLDNHGKAAELPGKPTEVQFMPDGKSVAYIAHDEKQACAVIAGIPGPKYGNVRELTISKDGKQIAYVAVKAGKEFVVLNGRETPANKVVSKLVFAKDGLRWLEFEKKEIGGNVILTQAGREVDRWELRNEFRRASLSPDGTVAAIVYAPYKDAKFEFVINNGVFLDKRYTKIDRITWGPDNLQAFVADIEVKSPTFPDYILTTRQVLVVGGKEDSQQYSAIVGELIFTDGKSEMTFYAGIRSPSNLSCMVWQPRDASSRYASIWSDMDPALLYRVPRGSDTQIISPIGSPNDSTVTLAVRPDGSHKRNVLLATPELISINGKHMKEVTLYKIKEAEK
jgi:hypothetical protein